MIQTSKELDRIMTKLSKHADEITFDAKAHRYTKDGVGAPSVSQVLSDVGLINTDWFTPEGMARGIEVHEILATEDNQPDPLGIFDSDTAYSGYLMAWRDFKKMSGFVPGVIETPIYSSFLGMAGTPDRIGTLGDRLCIVDIKTGTKLKWHGLQLAGYKLLLGQHGRDVQLRGVYLKKTGKFTIQDYTIESYITDMMICLQMYKVKRKYK